MSELLHRRRRRTVVGSRLGLELEPTSRQEIAARGYVYYSVEIRLVSLLAPDHNR